MSEEAVSQVVQPTEAELAWEKAMMADVNHVSQSYGHTLDGSLYFHVSGVDLGPPYILTIGLEGSATVTQDVVQNLMAVHGFAHSKHPLFDHGVVKIYSGQEDLTEAMALIVEVGYTPGLLPDKNHWWGYIVLTARPGKPGTRVTAYFLDNSQFINRNHGE